MAFEHFAGANQAEGKSSNNYVEWSRAELGICIEIARCFARPIDLEIISSEFTEREKKALRCMLKTPSAGKMRMKRKICLMNEKRRRSSGKIPSRVWMFILAYK